MMAETGAHRVIAKKSTVDAADIDREVARQVQLTISKLNDSAAKLTGIQSAKDASDILSRDSAEKLADEHSMRAKIFRQVAEMLEDPISALPMNLAEWDAHSFVKVRDCYGALQSRTNEGFEAVKGLPSTDCNAEHTRRTRAVCA